MKRLIMSLLVAVGIGQLTLSASAQEHKGIQFFEGTWNAALEKSKETGKPIFIDVYTEWCGPCKMMAKEIFPLEKVGMKYNGAFINYKIDAEKGEGVAIAKQYSINSFPTYLYIRGDGEVLHRSGGFSPDPEFFLGQADVALESAADPYTISKMTADFKGGKRDKDFLKKYIVKLNKLVMDNAEPLDAYLLQLSATERLLPENFNFLYVQMNSSPSKTFEFMVQHPDKVKQLAATDPEASYHLVSVLNDGLNQSMQTGKYDVAAKMFDYAIKLKDMNGYDANFIATQKLEYLNKTNKVTELLKATKDFIKEDAKRTTVQIKQENKRQFDEFMVPFLSGKRDSTEKSFDKMKEYFSTQYLANVASRLFLAAGYVNNRIKDKMELRKALAWSRKAEALLPEQKEYHELSAKILKKINRK